MLTREPRLFKPIPVILSAVFGAKNPAKVTLLGFFTEDGSEWHAQEVEQLCFAGILQTRSTLHKFSDSIYEGRDPLLGSSEFLPYRDAGVCSTFY